MLRSSNATVKQAHFHQILWLGNDFAIRTLFDLLTDEDSFVRAQALRRLNQLEHGKPFFVGSRELPSQPGHYFSLREDVEFRQKLLHALLAKFQ